MPQPGDPCGPTDTTTVNDENVVLYCRNGIWTRQARPPAEGEDVETPEIMGQEGAEEQTHGQGLGA